MFCGLVGYLGDRRWEMWHSSLSQDMESMSRHRLRMGAAMIPGCWRVVITVLMVCSGSLEAETAVHLLSWTPTLRSQCLAATLATRQPGFEGRASSCSNEETGLILVSGIICISGPEPGDRK
jgi:hypothetical protein